MEITLLSRGVIYQIDFDTAVNRLLYVESRNLYAKTIQNESGQHLEHAPFVSVILFCQQSWRLMMKRAIFIKIKRRNDA
jgi:hypothetical protein